MEHQTPKKALFLALFSLFAFTTATHGFLEPEDLLNAAEDHLKDKEDLLKTGKDKLKGAMDQQGLIKAGKDKLKGALDQGISALPPLASSPTSSQSSVLGNIDAELKEICGKTDFPSECVQEVMPFFTGQADPLHVVKSAMLGTMEKLKEAIEAARKMSRAPGSPGKITIINEVRESFEDALENFENAMEAFEAKDIGTMNTMLSAAITDFGDNEDKLTSKASELVAFDDQLSKMTSNCLAITSMLNFN